MLSTHSYKPTAYCDDKTAWEIIVLIARWLRMELKTRLKFSPYYGIAVDETTDKSTISQLIIYIKYLNLNSDGDLVVTVEFLDLVPLTGGTALDITVIPCFSMQMKLIVDRYSQVIESIQHSFKTACWIWC